MSIVALRPLGALLFRVTPYDPITYVSLGALLCAVASLGSYVPAGESAVRESCTFLQTDSGVRAATQTMPEASSTPSKSLPS